MDFVMGDYFGLYGKAQYNEKGQSERRKCDYESRIRQGDVTMEAEVLEGDGEEARDWL